MINIAFIDFNFSGDFEERERSIVNGIFDSKIMCYWLVDRLFSNASEHVEAVQKALQVANSTRNEQSPVSRCKCCKWLTSKATLMSVLQQYDPQMALYVPVYIYIHQEWFPLFILIL